MLITSNIHISYNINCVPNNMCYTSDSINNYVHSVVFNYKLTNIKWNDNFNLNL